MSLKAQRRILLISNNPLSKDSNNGITISNLLSSYNQSFISNLYFSNSNPNEKLANSYFKIADNEIIKLGCLKSVGTIVNSFSNYKTKSRSNKKTTFKVLIRELLWKIAHWNNKKLKEWIKTQNPEIIILQIGDSLFPIRIAKKISSLMGGIPILIYNSENYYFKDYNYFAKKTYKTLLYSIFFKLLKNSYNSIGFSSSWIHLTDEIKNKYEAVFNKSRHYVIRNVPNILHHEYKYKNGRFNVFYFGNLSLGRFDSLMVFSHALKEVNSSYKIYVYSSCTDEQILSIKKKDNIEYCGFKNIDNIYSEIYSKGDLLIHIESFENFSKIDLVDAFSTKIVDCLYSGIPFLLFAPSQLNCYKYLETNDACFLACNYNQLVALLRNISSDISTNKVNNARKLIMRNHNAKKNNILIVDIIESIINS